MKIIHQVQGDELTLYTPPQPQPASPTLWQSLSQSIAWAAPKVANLAVGVVKVTTKAIHQPTSYEPPRLDRYYSPPAVTRGNANATQRSKQPTHAVSAIGTAALTPKCPYCGR